MDEIREAFTTIETKLRDLFTRTNQLEAAPLVSTSALNSAIISVASTADSQNTSQSINVSAADSKGESAEDEAESLNTSQSSNVSTADSKAESAEDEAESLNTSQSVNVSTVESKVDSIIGGSGTNDSVARSMATSAVVKADSQNTSQSANVSVADSKAESAEDEAESLNASQSTNISTNLSTANYQNTSQSANVSVADSKAESAEDETESLNTSQSTNISTNLSVANSQNTSQSSNVSAADSKAESAEDEAESLDTSQSVNVSVALSTGVNAQSRAISAVNFANSQNTSQSDTISTVNSDAQSRAISAVNFANSQNTSQSTLISGADSKAESAEDEAESLDTSQSVNVSVALSTGTNAQSRAISAVNFANSQNTSQSDTISVADSKAESAEDETESLNTSQSTNISTNSSVASSQNTSQSTNVSVALSTATSIGLGAVLGKGSGAANRVTYWTDANTISSDAGLTVDTGNNMYTVADAGGFGNAIGTARLMFDSSGATDFANFNGCNVGINLAATIDYILSVGGNAQFYNNALNTTTSYYGIYNYQQKTAGATDESDLMYAASNSMVLNQAGGVFGYTVGTYSRARLDAGTVGAIGSDRYVMGESIICDINSGTINGSIYGIYNTIDQEAANTTTGDIYGIYTTVDADGTTSGLVYGLRIVGASNIDYGIYETSITTGTINYLQSDTGFGVNAPTAQVHIDQNSSTGAQSALFINQQDVSEQHIICSINGSDVDFPAIIQVYVTGSPKFWWDESEDSFALTKSLLLPNAGIIGISNTGLRLEFDNTNNNIDVWTDTGDTFRVRNITSTNEVFVVRDDGDVECGRYIELNGGTTNIDLQSAYLSLRPGNVLAVDTYTFGGLAFASINTTADSNSVLHVYQTADTGPVVLTLQQADVDVAFIEFLTGTVYTGKTAQDEYIKVLNPAGATRYLRLHA